MLQTTWLWLKHSDSGRYQQTLVHYFTILFIYSLLWKPWYFILSILIYFSWKIFQDYVSIQYILPYLLPRPSSTRTQTSIETCAPEAATLQRSWDSLSHHAESGILWILASQPKPVCLVTRSPSAISEYALDRSHLAATDAPVSDTSSSVFAAHTTSHVTSNHYHFRHHHLHHSPPHLTLSLHPSPILRQPIPRPHHTTPNNHTAHQAQLPLRQRGSPTTNTTTAIRYMGIHCFAKFNPPPGAEYAMFTAWILSFSQLPYCFGKAKRSLRWDCSARVVTWDSFPQGI